MVVVIYEIIKLACDQIALSLELETRRLGTRPLHSYLGEKVSIRKTLLGTVMAVLPMTLVANASDTSQSAAKVSPAAEIPSLDPYTNPKALDPYLGADFFTRLFNYYSLEMGHDGPPPDPSAPSARRADYPPAPESIPPYPFAEWPYGGASNLGSTRPNSVDSPLMVAIGNTSLGQTLNDAHIQIYGWGDVGGNLSNNKVHGGNVPAGYDYNPNRIQFDQGVVYFERLPDTVQKDHIDWGFRVAPIFGADYRYTTAFGYASYQLLKKNHEYGYDVPMAYGEVFIPQIADGLLLRLGRFISLPDIEAQLAPNNYMYSHSLAYTFDNYTNTGLQSTLAVNRNVFLQFGITAGSDTSLFHGGLREANPYPNPLYPGSTFARDPGAVPSFTAGIRLQNDSGEDSLYVVADAINGGEWGYNNLQWIGATYYHKFDEHWHISVEIYNLSQNHVPNLNNPIAVDAIANNGTPFSPAFIPRNAPNAARCKNPNVLSCTASAQAVLAYTNYKFSPLDNISLRTEFYNDAQGQRTGTKTGYLDFGIGWQHWFSPQIEVRPEFTYYRSINAAAFNGDANRGIAPNHKNAFIASGDLIVHF